MASNTTLIDYALYDKNDHMGRVPFLDDATARADLNAKIRRVLNVSA